jgi:hypothetical protein
MQDLGYMFYGEIIHFQMLEDKLLPEPDILTSKTECFV